MFSCTSSSLLSTVVLSMPPRRLTCTSNGSCALIMFHGGRIHDVVDSDARVARRFFVCSLGYAMIYWPNCLNYLSLFVVFVAVPFLIRTRILYLLMFGFWL